MLKIEHLAHLMIATRIKPHWGQKKEKKKKKIMCFLFGLRPFYFILQRSAPNKVVGLLPQRIM